MTQAQLPGTATEQPATAQQDNVLIKNAPRRNVPFLSDFMAFLVLNGHARQTGFTAKGYPTYESLATSSVHVLVGTDVRIPCVCCGSKVHAPGSMNPITIGCLVQYSDEVELSPWLSEQEWKIRPTSRTALGCPDCFARFEDAKRAVNTLNRQRQAIYSELLTAQSLALQLHKKREQFNKLVASGKYPQLNAMTLAPAVPFTVTEIPAPTVLTAYIDVGEEVLLNTASLRDKRKALAANAAAQAAKAASTK